jgi:hypothetical protein
MALTQALLMILALGASPPPPPAGGDYIKVEIRGTLRAGMMAIGGRDHGHGDHRARGQLGARPQGCPRAARRRSRWTADRAREGLTRDPPGVERRERAIVTVTSLEPAPATP